MTKSGQNRQFFVRRDLYTWRITLSNNRAPLITYFKLCASFRSHWWIQTGVTVRKWPIWVKMEFFSAVTLTLDGWPWKNNRAHLLWYFTLCALFRLAICEFKLELQSGNAHIGAKFVLTGELDFCPQTFTVCRDITFVNGNNSWQFPADTITGTLWKRCDRRTGGQKCS